MPRVRRTLSLRANRAAGDIDSSDANTVSASLGSRSYSVLTWRAPDSQLATHSIHRDAAGVLGRRAQDEDLGGDALEQPSQIVVAQPRVLVFVGGDDDPVEV